MAATRHRQVIRTGALSWESRPMTVVAAKMTTRKWSWKNGLIRETGESTGGLEASFVGHVSKAPRVRTMSAQGKDLARADNRGMCLEGSYASNVHVDKWFHCYWGTNY